MQKKKYNFFDQGENFAPPPKLFKVLSFIHECKGKQDLFVVEKPAVVRTLVQVAKINSTISSNAIENIVVSESRLKALMLKKTKPINRNEEEVLGYKDVLSAIHESFDDIPITPNIILQLHRDLFSHVKTNGNYGKWKLADNVIVEIDGLGKKHVRFRPTSAYDTPQAMEELCRKYNEVIKKYKNAEHLFLIAEFILTFLCIHPFDDGNGRMSRLLTLLLMYKSGYTVGKYISIEKMIEKSKGCYYDSLEESSKGGENQKHSTLPFLNYFILVVSDVYNDFLKRAIEVSNIKRKKFDLIKDVFNNVVGKITKAKIKEMYPNISETTIELALRTLIRQKYIIKLGYKKYAYYVRA